MCVIICCDRKSGHIDKSMLKSAEKMNQDGMGIAWINRDNKVQWIKGLKSKEIMRVIKQVKPSLKKGYIVHARIRSSGEVCDSLTHPFEISKDANDSLEGITDKGVLFHNGTVDLEEIMMKTLVKNQDRMYKGKNSDTRMMAYLAYAYGIEFLSLFKGEKIAVLTPKGIKLFGDFPTVKKHSCSNSFFENTTKYYTMYDYDDNEYDIMANGRYMSKSYCAQCDRNLPETKFTKDYETCDECFERRVERENDKIIDENFINAKQYMNKYYPKWDNKLGSMP